MNDREALLAAIAQADPGDVAPRLVFADWIEADAPAHMQNPEWAELIRLECRLGGKNLGLNGLGRLVVLREAFLTRLVDGTHWHHASNAKTPEILFGKVDPTVRPFTYYRYPAITWHLGFPVAVLCGLQVWLEDGGKLKRRLQEAGAPKLQHVELKDRHPQQVQHSPGSQYWRWVSERYFSQYPGLASRAHALPNWLLDALAQKKGMHTKRYPRRDAACQALINALLEVHT